MMQGKKRKRDALIAKAVEAPKSTSLFLSILPPLSTGSKKGLKGDDKKMRGWSNNNSYDPKLEPKKTEKTKLEKALEKSFADDAKDRLL